MSEALESAYPWTLENGTTTVLHLKNTTKEIQTVGVIIRYAGETYVPDGFDLQPYQTIAVDIKKLRDSEQPDGQGHLIPSDATQGQLVWMQQTPYTVIGRAEGTDVAAGTSRSFSCITGCCDNYWSDFSLNPDPMNGPGGTGGQFSATNIGTDCFGNGFVWYNVQAKATSWTTSNAAVATVSSSGYAYCAAPGSATVTGNFNDKNYYMKPPLYSQCAYNAVTSPAPAPVNVAYPINFHLTNFTTSNGVLTFQYAWSSSTGNLADLSSCTVGESVTYPGAPATFFWPSPPFPNNPPVNPNPAIINLSATPGFLTDNHIWNYGYGGFVKPYNGSFFDASQVYQYICANQTQYTALTGPLTIDRTVSPSTGTAWKYVITKTGGYTASIDPLP